MERLVISTNKSADFNSFVLHNSSRSVHSVVDKNAGYDIPSAPGVLLLFLRDFVAVNGSPWLAI